MKVRFLFIPIFNLFIFSLAIAQTSGIIEGDLCYCPNGPYTCLIGSESYHSITMPYDGMIVFDNSDATLQVYESNGFNPYITVGAIANYTDSDGVPRTVPVGGLGSLNDPSLNGQFKPVRSGVTIDITVQLIPEGNCIFNGDYSLPYSIVPFTFEQDAEPNDEYPNQATLTLENTYYQGRGSIIPDDLTAEDDEIDWYKLIAPRTGILTIDLESNLITDETVSQTNLLVRNSSFNTLASIGILDGFITSESVHVNCVNEGDEIFIRPSGTNNSYRFKWNIAEPSGFVDNEPNNDFTQAIAINLGETKTGNIGAGILTQNEDVADWYSFSLTEPGDIEITVGTTEELTNLSNTLFKLNTSNDLINAGSMNSDETNVFRASCLSPGTYFFAVSDESDSGLFNNAYGTCASCCFNYSININQDNFPTYSDDAENNNSYNDALFITQDGTYEGQIGYRHANTSGYDSFDYYEFSVANNGSVIITFTEPFPENGAILRAGNSNQNPIGDIITNANNEITQLTFDCAQTGETYYLVLNSDTCLSYQFMYTNFPTGLNNEIEPNNTNGQRQIFNSNDIINGHLGYGYINNWDTYDYFEIPVGIFAPLEVNLDITGNANITLYENFSIVNELTQDMNSGPIINLTYNNADPNKLYFLRLYSIDNDGNCSSYTLNGWSQGFIANNDSEPNNNTLESIIIIFDETYEGQLSYYSTGSDTVDYYSFNLAESDEIEFALNAYEGLSSNVTLTVFDSSNDNQVFQLTHDGLNQSRTVSATLLSPGNYYITITGSGETGSYDFKLSQQESLGINESQIDEMVTIFPVPAKDELNISLNPLLLGLEGKVFDVTGKLVSSFICHNKDTRLQINSLKNGVYFLRLESKEYTTTKKFIKQ